MRAKLALSMVIGLLAVAAFAGSASAAQLGPRLEGSGQIALTITAANNFIPPAGTTGTSTWTFSPSCATGACTTQVGRTHLTSSAVTTYNAVPNALGTVYTGTTTYTTDCFAPGGTVQVSNGVTQTEKLTLKVTATDGQGDVTGVSGTLALSETPNATGQAGGCLPGTATATFTGPVTPPQNMVTARLSSTFYGAIAATAAGVLGGDRATVTGTGAGQVAQICMTATWTINGKIIIPSDFGFMWNGQVFPFETDGWNPVGRTDTSGLTPGQLFGHVYEETATHSACGPTSKTLVLAAGVGAPALVITGLTPITSISHSVTLQLETASGAVLNTVTGTSYTSGHGGIDTKTAETCEFVVGQPGSCSPS